MDIAYLDDRKDFISDAMAEIGRGYYSEAIAIADARLKLFPVDMDAYIMKAFCLAKMGNPSEAEEIAEGWSLIVRDQSKVFEAVGDAYGSMGKGDEAMRAYGRFIEINSGSPAADRVSKKVSLIKDSETGVDEDGPARELDNFNTITLARLYVKQGHFRMAGEIMDKVVEANPDNHEAREYARYVHRLMEDGWKPVINVLDRWLCELQKRVGL